jgi:cation:H+ antiporter
VEFLILIAGVAGLWLGTELTIGGALAIAKRHRLSEFFVGLVILSIGSDLPELAVAADAGVKGLMGVNASAVVVGTSLGSVVAQIGFVLGLVGVISHLTLPRRYTYRHGSALLAATVVLYLVALDGHVSRVEGSVLIALYAGYVVALMNGSNVPDEEPRPLAGGGWSSWLALLIGLSVVTASSEVTVNQVVGIAQEFHISEGLISVLIIGIGTSLPELSISIGAILKKRTELSVGNIIGSNILDTLLPIGLAAVISEVTVERGFVTFDIPYIFVLTVVVLTMFAIRRGIRRPEGLVILSAYACYVILKLLQY